MATALRPTMKATASTMRTRQAPATIISSFQPSRHPATQATTPIRITLRPSGLMAATTRRARTRAGRNGAADSAARVRSSAIRAAIPIATVPLRRPLDGRLDLGEDAGDDVVDLDPVELGFGVEQ